MEEAVELRSRLAAIVQISVSALCAQSLARKNRPSDEASFCFPRARITQSGGHHAGRMILLRSILVCERFSFCLWEHTA